uniref:Uncharacterized protein n=1 Tax=Pichia etchellsii TaxID=28550 RepID=Q9C127_PICET|nr:hypothetical protein [Schwanniomyces etchellsii]
MKHLITFFLFIKLVTCVYWKNYTTPTLFLTKTTAKQNADGTCYVHTMASGESCAFLIEKFTNVETEINLNKWNEDNPTWYGCSNGHPYVGDKVCVSEGNFPDYSPKPNSNGTCYTYYIKSGDTCYDLASKYYLSTEQLESFNEKTYGWFGCNNLQLGQAMCLGKGTPPKPIPNPKAECGPLASGDLYNSECPNKACCSQYGFCGTTSEFCDKKSSNTNSPGTTGCYSNCGYGNLPTKSASSFKKVAYWIDTDSSMYMDPLTINGYDIVHYSFAIINSDLSISVGSGFDDFLKITSKKIIAFGGWDFSTNPNTYNILREVVSDSKINTFANNVINFINEYNLDGVNFDWEYPGAPDIPGIPAGDKKDGKRYSDLIGLIKQGIGSKLVSVALPAAYWYLKAFPLTDMDKHMDYFIIMNYDYYGQWDYNTDTGIGCHVDKRNTTDIIKMITKSGIDTTKVYGGVANYARTYKLKDNNCNKYGCDFTGPESNAITGDITRTPGIMTENELLAIDKSTRTRWSDTDSHCDIMTYEDNTNWAAWMKSSERTNLINWYKDIGLGGSALWAVNYDITKANEDSDNDSITCEISVNDDDFDVVCNLYPVNMPIGSNKGISYSKYTKIINTILKVDIFSVEYLDYIKFILKNCIIIEQYSALYGSEVVKYAKRVNSIFSKIYHNIDINLSGYEDHKKDSIDKIIDYYYIITYTIPYETYLFSDREKTIEHWGDTNNNERKFIKSVTDISSASSYNTRLYKICYMTDDSASVFNDDIYTDPDYLPSTDQESSDYDFEFCDDSMCQTAETDIIFKNKDSLLLDIKKYLEELDLKMPVFIVNLHGKSPGVECNALKYVSENYDTISNKNNFFIFNLLEQILIIMLKEIQLHF